MDLTLMNLIVENLQKINALIIIIIGVAIVIVGFFKADKTDKSSNHTELGQDKIKQKNAVLVGTFIGAFAVMIAVWSLKSFL